MIPLPPYARQVELPEPARPEDCLGPTDVIDCDHPAITARAAGLSGEPAAVAAALFALVRDAIGYDLAPSLGAREDWRASATLARGRGFCQQKAVLLAALGRAAKIPTALCFEHIRDHKLLEPRFSRLLPDGVIAFHGLVAFHLGGAWVRADPTLDRGLTESRGYRLVEFDGARPAHLPGTDRQGRPHFDRHGDFGPFADLPRSISDTAIGLGKLWDQLRQAKGAL